MGSILHYKHVDCDVDEVLWQTEREERMQQSCFFFLFFFYCRSKRFYSRWEIFSHLNVFLLLNYFSVPRMTMWKVFISEKTSSGPKCFSVAGQILAPGSYV